MVAVQQTMLKMLEAGDHWRVPLMDFVDAVRRERDWNAVREPFVIRDAKLAALLAAVVEHLCDEMCWEVPGWLADVPPAPRAWFVSGLESLKSIAISETPPAFRARRVFVLENFLTRV